MELKGRKIGVALTGSFCTFEKIFVELQKLVDAGAEVYTIFSDASQSIKSRFGTPEEYMKKAEEITKRPPILAIETAEPIGPKSYLDALVIFPCTGNTAAKLANGITDTPVLMGAKAHLRNGKPLLISISTNDGLGMNMKNIGLLLNAKNIYFLPFGQDSPEKKPNSLIAHTDELIPSLEMALEHRQIQPILKSF
ncbi:MAG: dipicolinate synthase subunit B [Lachnospiraceae bacterium]|jgi:dipicolinate synthase subunit B|nr:dipicolinate synthase subunit B [Lachnospiraceae bacterium]MCI9100952.1 dipicolinate synthase subunit B [Lachnospiraceae bacterium]MCI9357194.1 dipicolinate synthase subunit B [Lachnospiraceae bacterium]